MRKAFLPVVKATFPILAGMFTTCFISTASAQQHIIVNKDNTRPEVTRQFREQARNQAVISSFDISRHNGYNEVAWGALSDAAANVFVVEYSVNGTDYLAAGQSKSGNGAYSIKHYTNERRPITYRIKAEHLNGNFSYSETRVLEGIADPPVKLQSTIIRGNVVNVIANKPVQRINVFSADGTQVYARDINGRSDLISTVLPGLSKGMYYMNFYGDGWKNTQKFVVP